MSKIKVKDTQSFIEKARSIHGDTYDYSLVDYNANRTKVRIICAEHGEFLMTPCSHLQGSRCKKCSYYEGASSRVIGAEVFARRATEIHGDKYTYEEVKYVNNSTKVKIRCKIHGIFEQNPSAHLRG